MSKSEIEELRYFIRDMYLKNRHANVSVEEIENAQYPPSLDAPNVWRITPYIPMSFDDSPPPSITAPLPVTVDLRAELVESGHRRIKLWHGYCPENETVYFAFLPKHL